MEAMALLLTPLSPSLLFKTTDAALSFLPLPSTKTRSLSFSLLPTASRYPRFYPAVRSYYTFSGDSLDPVPGNPPVNPAEEEAPPDDKSDGAPSGIVDEWGERAEPELEPPTKLPETDPPINEDEWEEIRVGDGYAGAGNGSAPSAAAGVVDDDKLMELKRCLVDTFYGTELGLRASAEVRAEASELISQLEASNPTPAPTEAVELLDGNWVLLYTAFSELLPLLAVGSSPFLKVEGICQLIDANNLTIENSTTLSSPFASFSFSASAKFEVRTPSRIQVEFKEGTFKPPEIKSKIDLPESVDIFGQKISLSPVQQSISPLQEAVASIARGISGQAPLKVPIPGEQTKSWLLITYLDKDLRISRGDGGLFVLAKEGSPLLNMW